MAKAPDAQVAMWAKSRGRCIDPGGGWIDLVCEILRSQPRLDGGLCRDQAATFDLAADDDDGAPTAALALCEACPVASRCAAWAAGMPVGSLTGVVAGRVIR